MRGHCGEAERRVRRRGQDTTRRALGSARGVRCNLTGSSDSNTMLRCTKPPARQALPPLPVAHDRPAATDPQLSARRSARPRHVARGRARHSLAAHAAAVRARSHQSVAARRRRRLDAGRLRLRRRADARALGDAFRRRRSAASRSTRIIATHYHPDHLGNAAWLAARFGCPVAMTAGRIPDRARDRRRAQRLRRGADAARCSAAHGMAAEHVGGAGGARQSLPARRAGAAAQRSSACSTATTSRIGRHRLARDRRLRPFARARVALLRASAAC